MTSIDELREQAFVAHDPQFQDPDAYDKDEWQVAYAYYFFAAITGVLLAVILYLIVVAI